jgi:hypothetical protein
MRADGRAHVTPARCKRSTPRGTSIEVVLVAMRKRTRVPLFAALAAAIIVPVGFALSLEQPGERSALSAVHGVVPVAQIRTTTAPIIATTTAAVPSLPEVPEGAKLMVIGTGLFGLAAAMRRSSKRDG